MIEGMVENEDAFEIDRGAICGLEEDDPPHKWENWAFGWTNELVIANNLFYLSQSPRFFSI